MYRNFNQDRCRNFYKKLREIQTVSHVLSLKSKYDGSSLKMNVWNALESLSDLVDESDPDIHIGNIHHAFQTAKGVKEAGEPEWMILIALIHDLGKILYTLPQSNDKDGTSISTQYSVVGDTFIVGCKLPDGLVLSEYNRLNSDMNDPQYNTKYGMYSPNIGFDECLFSFGHDEYLYQIIKYNISNNPNFNWNLPEEALYIIRYHSFYPWHTPLKGHENEYVHLASSIDKNRKDLLKKFSRFDLYTKSDTKIDIESEKQYYTDLINKFIGTTYWCF